VAAVEAERPVLTDRERRAVEFLARHEIEPGYPATRRELAAALGCSSPNAAQEVLARLHRKGYVTSEPGKARTVRVIGGVA
jgi:repressor LexA